MGSPYYLAIDVRPDAVTAAIAEPVGADCIGLSSLRLGVDGALPAAVFVAADELLFGDAAIERGAAEPDSVSRDFFPHEGAPDPSLVLAGEEFSRIDLYAWMVDAIVSQVAEDRGARASGIWVVVPDLWSDAQLDAVADAFDRDGRAEVDFITVSEALAGRFWQLEETEATDLTAVIADLEERTLTTRIARISPDGGSMPIGAPIVAPVIQSGVDSAHLERLAIRSIIDGLQRAGIGLEAVDVISLSGASPRVDEFEQLLMDAFGDPIAVDPDPAAAAALGASFALARESDLAAALVTVGASSLGTSHAVARSGPGSTKWYRRAAPVAAIGIAAIVLAGGAAFASVAGFASGRSTGDDTEASQSGSTETASVNDAPPSAAPSESPSSTPSPVVSQAPPDPGAVDPPSAPANPRIPNPTPQVPSAPVTTPVPPAQAAPLPAETNPPAAPDPVVSNPADPPSDELPESPDPETSQEPTPTTPPPTTTGPETSQEPVPTPTDPTTPSGPAPTDPTDPTLPTDDLPPALP